MQDNNDFYTLYTIHTNNILSKNMALGCILLKMVDGENQRSGQCLEALMQLILDQGMEIDNFRTICENNEFLSTDILRLASKNVGASSMIERLMVLSSQDDKSPEPGDLTECLLTLVQSQFIDIQSVRAQVSSS